MSLLLRYVNFAPAYGEACVPFMETLRWILSRKPDAEVRFYVVQTRLNLRNVSQMGPPGLLRIGAEIPYSRHPLVHPPKGRQTLALKPDTRINFFYFLMMRSKSACAAVQVAKKGKSAAPLLANDATTAAVGDVLRSLRTHNAVLADHPFAEMYTSLRVRCLPAAPQGCHSALLQFMQIARLLEA